VLGLVVGLAIVGAIWVVAGVAGVAVLAVGQGQALLLATTERPTTAPGWVRVGAAAPGGLVAAGTVVVGAGRATAWSASLLLGSVGSDRLALAEARLRREQEYRRLSRDLHDGVGHALSAISLQAAAGRRMLAGDLQRTAVALEAIESLAGAAVGELDDVLGMLRDGAPRHPEPGLDQLDELVRTHRELGMQLQVDTEDEGEVGGIVGRTAYRVCAEGLSNAAKHGAPGPVTRPPLHPER